MPCAARIQDLTDHGGIITTGAPLNVLIGGKPAAVAGDTHLCPVPPSAGGPHPPSPVQLGSLTVRIAGRGALRVGDRATGCGARIVTGAPNVLIGG